MKKYIYPLAITATLLAATSCSDDEVNAVDQPIPDSQKEMISFSLSDGAASTRAGFTTQTRIIARIQSDEKGTDNTRYTKTALKAAVDGTNSTTSFSEVSYYDSNTRYWDDAFGRKAKLSVYAVAIPNSEDDSKLTFDKVTGGTTWATETTPNNTIVWDVVTTDLTSDKLNAEDLVYSNNIQEYNYTTSIGGTDGIYRWDYSAKAYKPDNTGADGAHKNGQMLFYQETMTDATAASTMPSSEPGHFDKGHLKFNHALSRMTVILVEGDGFDKTSANKNNDFKFTGTTENLTLLNMYVKGSLDIRTGEWSINKTIEVSNDNVKNISKLAKTTSETTADGTYVAQMLPDYVFTDGSNTNVMQFTIDNNTYYVTQDMLFDALTYDKDGDDVYDSADGDGELVGTTGSIKMQQGKNYTFKITVNKTKIEKITASLAPWIDVTAANKDIDNSHVSFTLTSPTGTNCTDIQFYRLAESLGSIYTDDSYTSDKGVNYSGDYKTEGAATLTIVNSKYQTNWFYDDNKTAYHFRTLNVLAADEPKLDSENKSENLSNSGTPSVTSFTMKADATTKDYHWGAPMKSDATFAYNTTEGYKSSLYPALISTKSDINITELHMMSNINIVLKTTTDANKVDLTGATVTLTKLSTSALVDMGIGLITPIAPTSPTTYATSTQATTAPTTYWESETTKVQTKSFTCSAIPQSLTRGSAADDYVGLTITTANGNQYFVSKLSEILAEGIKKGDTSFDDPDHPMDSEGKYQAITRWYPNHTYTYTFTLSKAAIENITATVAQWVNVTAGNTNLDLEK